MRRRSFLRLLAGSTLASSLPFTAGPARAADSVFQHGVASGDPLTDSVILWTRVSGINKKRVKVRWRIARDEALKDTVARGRVTTGPTQDYTVKVDVKDLAPGTRYYYAFEAGGAESMLGTTKTLPEGAVEAATFAVVSCSNYPYGFFNVYRDIAKSAGSLDAVIHLGDYIYEYGVGGYATEYAEALGRIPEPPVETVTLEHYRARHAQYKSDPDSQAMLSRVPLIAVWDDHEITNDAWRDGAENHQPEEGEFGDRAAAAVQAYFEWMPIRGEAKSLDTRIFRSFQYGDLLSLVMLDTRLYGRDAQPYLGEGTGPEAVGEALRDPGRRMLGETQEAWLENELKASSATWQLIGQQVLVAPLRSPNLGPLVDLDSDGGLPREVLENLVAISESNPPMLLDTWNGYPLAREDFLATLAQHASNPVILTGDMHTSSASNVYPLGFEEPVAVELMTTSVTSPGFDQYLPQVRPNAVRDATLDFNPPLRYMETSRRGWLAVQFTQAECTAEWHLVNTVHDRNYAKVVDKRFKVSAGAIGEGLRDA